MSPGVLALAIGVCGAAAVLGNAVRHKIPVRRFLKYAAPAFIGGFACTAIAYMNIPVLWPVLSAAPAAGSWWLSERFGAISYHREGLQQLLVARLHDVIPDWKGLRSILIDWSGGSDPKGIAKIRIALPAKVLPAKVLNSRAGSPGIKTVITDTVGGQWSVSTKDNLLTFTPAVAVRDPEPVERLKAVLADKDCFGEGYKLKQENWDLTADGTAVERYRVGYANGNAFAKTKHKRQGIEKVLRTRVPVASGSWMFEWDLAAAELSAVMSAFEPIIRTPAIEHFVTSREEAIRTYPSAEFIMGLYGDGSPAVWNPLAEGTPHCNTCGQSGKGKTSWAHTLITQAAALGWCIIIADFKLSRSYRGFLDWPNVHVCSNGLYSNIKTIYYVVELLNSRQGTGASSSAVSNDVPILFIIDEFAYFAMQMAKTVWPRFKQRGDPGVPPVLSEIDQLIVLAREFKIHIVTMLQKPSAEFINPNVIFNSGKKIQVGNMEGPQSNTYWGDYDIGSSFADVPGRGLVKDFADDVPAREFQAHFTPDPVKAHKPEDLEVLSNLLPPVSLYPRFVFDMPSPYDITRWDEIITAPWELAAERPDLDPLSPYFRPQPIFTFQTLKDLDPASMSVNR